FILATFQPHAFQKQVWELAGENNLFPSLIQIIDLHRFFGGKDDSAASISAIVCEIEMAANRLRSRSPQSSATRSIIHCALIVGGGPAGLAAAHRLARLDMDVVLIEKKDRLGGNLVNIHTPELKQAIEECLTAVESHSRITIYKNAEVIGSSGIPGQFVSRIRLNSDKEINLGHGVLILATGGRPSETGHYGLGTHDRIITQYELEKRIYDPLSLQQQLKSVVMIQCVGSREEPHNYCSRICCLKSLRNALKIKAIHPDADIYVFYRDMMTYGESEQVYTQARKKGILFIPFNVDTKPKVKVVAGQPLVEGRDPILGSPVRLKPDLIVLAPGILPNPIGDLARIFNLAITRDGFMEEADYKWRPVETDRQGVFVAGLARGPARVEEAMQEGEAAAGFAFKFSNREVILSQRLAARVRHGLCAQCELCLQACPFRARYVDRQQGQILVDHAACQGCGACAAICPNSATVIGDYEDNGIMDMIEAAL
ncbi:CoB--CoM heterodisulfide reductase iron-sulfur subunit A family protein, partial [Thermodesulfobacteriota bacterium]